MGLGGFILGGALAGAGKGLAMQAEQNALERREARLAAARQAERQEDRTWRKEDLQFAEDSGARTDERRHGYNIIEENVKLGGQLTIAKEGNAAANARAEADRAHDLRLRAIDQAFDANQKAKDRALDLEKTYGEPVDKDIDYETGEVVYHFRKKGGGLRQERIKIDARKPETESSTSLIPKPPATVAKPGNSSAGTFTAKTDADAERFTSNPANKGKSFIGPDGKRYTVQ